MFGKQASLPMQWIKMWLKFLRSKRKSHLNIFHSFFNLPDLCGNCLDHLTRGIQIHLLSIRIAEIAARETVLLIPGLHLLCHGNYPISSTCIGMVLSITTETVNQWNLPRAYAISEVTLCMLSSIICECLSLPTYFLNSIAFLASRCTNL